MEKILRTHWIKKLTFSRSVLHHNHIKVIDFTSVFNWRYRRRTLELYYLSLLGFTYGVDGATSYCTYDSFVLAYTIESIFPAASFYEAAAPATDSLLSPYLFRAFPFIFKQLKLQWILLRKLLTKMCINWLFSIGFCAAIGFDKYLRCIQANDTIFIIINYTYCTLRGTSFSFAS